MPKRFENYFKVFVLSLILWMKEYGFEQGLNDSIKDIESQLS